MATYLRRRSSYSSRRRARTRAATPRRANFWVRQTVNNATPAAPPSANAFNLLPDVSLDPGARLGSTVVRTHIDFFLTFTASFTAIVNSAIWIGLARYDFALVSGISPATSWNNVDWAVWRKLSVSSLNSQAFGDPSTQVQFSIDAADPLDVKSARRMEEQSDTWVFFVQPVATPAVAEIDVTSSVLLKLA